MDNVKSRYVLDTAEKLLKESTCFLLLDSLVLYYVVKKFTSVAILHNEIKFLLSLNNFVKLYYLRMLNYLENMDLS